MLLLSILQSILAPVIDCGSYIEFLNEKEVDHINNKMFGGTKVFRDVKMILQKEICHHMVPNKYMQ